MASPTAAAIANTSHAQRCSSTGGSNSGSSGSSGIVLAAALLAGESELLQTAAAASMLLRGEEVTSQQQQLLAQAAAAAAAEGGDGLGPMLWDGDVAAMVAAVLAAVSACQATNQWARVEQLLDAAGAGLLAAAAVNGVILQQPGLPSAEAARRMSSSSNESYDSAAEGSAGDELADGDRAQEQPAQQQRGQQRGRVAAAGDTTADAAGGWGDGWSSEGEDQEHNWHSASGRHRRP